MTAVLATCADCGHQWTLATYTGRGLNPIRVEGTRCPRCRSPNRHVADQRKEASHG